MLLPTAGFEKGYLLLYKIITCKAIRIEYLDSSVIDKYRFSVKTTGLVSLEEMNQQ